MGTTTTTQNPMLARLFAQRDEQVAFVEQMTDKANEAGRDLVEAEVANLRAAQERVAQLDAQIAPLVEFEQSRAAHASAMPAPAASAPRSSSAPAGGRLSARERVGVHEYPTPGHFMVDKIRSQTHYGPNGEEYAPDAGAIARIRAARGEGADVMGGVQNRAEGDVAVGVHQTTADTPGLLPVTIQGQVEEQLDGLRPFLSFLGIKPLAGIPGKTFHRPHVTQHTKVGKQQAEKAELASRELKVDGIPFNKETVGGWLNISRQDIDWTSPGAWNIILNDLQAEYAEETDAITAATFATGVTQAVPAIPLADAEKVEAWIRALYAAATMTATKNGTVRASVRRLPDAIFTSMDMWENIGAMLDIAAVNLPGMRVGEAGADTFAGSILRFPRIMVPGLPSGTVVVGRKTAFEFYEERVGLLTAVVPRVFGVEIAYGGYMAAGFLDATKFAKVSVAAA